MPDLRARKPTGWTTISFPDGVKRLAVASGLTENGQLALSVIAEQGNGPNLVETGVLDVDPEDESLLANDVPRTEDGTSVPLAQLRPGDS